MLHPTAASVGGCPWELVDHALRREQEHPHVPLFGSWRQVDSIRSGSDGQGRMFIEWEVLEVDLLGCEHRRRHIAYRVTCPHCGKPMASGRRHCRRCEEGQGPA